MAMNQGLVLTLMFVIFGGLFATSMGANAAEITGINQTAWDNANVTIINSTSTAVWVDSQAQVTTEFVAKAIFETQHIRVSCYQNVTVMNEIRAALNLPPLNLTGNEIFPFYRPQEAWKVMSVTDQNGRPLLYRLVGGPLLETPYVQNNFTVGYGITYIGFGGMDGERTIYKVESAIDPFWINGPVEQTIKI